MPPTVVNGKICYIEIPALDIQRSADFYAKVFGWEIRTAIRPLKSIRIGSRSSTRPIFPSTLQVTPPSAPQFLTRCDSFSVAMS